MPRLKPGTILPTTEEDAKITKAAMMDPDAMPYSDEEWAAIQPSVRRGRPFSVSPKQRITIRVDQETIEVFRARAEEIGGNYQSIMNEALRYVGHWVASSPKPEIKASRWQKIADKTFKAKRGAKLTISASKGVAGGLFGGPMVKPAKGGLSGFSKRSVKSK